MRWDEVGLLPIDEKPERLEKLENKREICLALLLRRPYDEYIVQIKDDSNPPRSKKRDDGFGQRREDERSQAQPEWKNKKLVQFVLPAEAEEAVKMMIYRHVEVRIFQIYRGCPIPRP